VLAANQLAAKLHGTSPEKLVGSSLFELRRVSDLTSTLLERAVGRDVALGFGYHVRADGSTFPVQLSVHPSELGGRPAWLCVLKSLEDSLSEQPDRSQARLFESLGRLSAGVAHDLNNLLSVILSFSSLASSQLEDAAPVQSDLAEIRGAAERAASLTKQLLSLSRTAPSAPKPVVLNDVVKRMEKFLRRLLDEQLTLELSLDPALDAVMADSIQLERLLMQLVSEARMASSSGGTLMIETKNVDLESESADGRHVMLRVTDSGMGLSPEVAARVFEPLSDRASGLASLVDAAGSTAWLESEPGSGTRFVACFPSLGREARGDAARRERRQARGEVVLVVEDNPHLRKTLRTYFTRDGYSVLDADCSIEALRLAEQAPRIDLLLTDFILTDGSGPELARTLRVRLPALKVLIAAGHPEQRAAVHEDAHTAFIRKPFDLREFADLVFKLLDATP
jgi:two-component system cell cycle sensor histidine kinase/response regulator CckA